MELTRLAGSAWLTGHAGNSPGQGPFMRVRFRREAGVVRSATYETYLCPACHDCGKALCEMIEGRLVEEAKAIQWDHLAERVGPLPRAKRICYSLALLALAEALKQA